MKGETWTAREVELLVKSRRSGFEWSATAARVGRSIASCKQRWSNMSAKERAARGERAPSKILPNAVLLDAQRRHEARSEQSLTGLLFGDPPPGFSALDRRGAR